MSTAATQEPQVTARLPIHGGWDGLFLYARTKEIMGLPVTSPDFDAELHVETTTIMFADVVESVRLVQENEASGVRRIRSLLKRLAVQEVPQHGGIVLERRGDGLLVKFEDSRAAATCAIAFHLAAAHEFSDYPNESPIALRIALHRAEVISDESAIYGQGINLAARLNALAEAGETVSSAAVKEALVLGFDADAHDLGECYLRHVERPIHVYRLTAVAVADAAVTIVPKAEPADSVLPKIAVVPLSANGAGAIAAAASVLTEEITYGLSRVPELRVLSRLTMQNVTSATVSVPALAARFGANYVVSGTVRARGSVFEVVWELCDASDESVIWVDRVSLTENEIVTADSPVVASICTQTLRKILDHGLTVTASLPLPSLKSHTLLTGAIALMHRGGGDSDRKATVVLDELMDRHKRNPTPYAWAAKQRFLRMWRGWSGDVAREGALARQYADQSLQKGSISGLAHAVRGMIASHLDRDFVQSRRCYEDALAVDPNEPLTWIFKCALHTFDGDGATAASCGLKAMDLSPFDPLSYYYKTLAAGGLLTDGQYDLAIRHAAAALSQNKFHHSTYRVLAIAYGLAGRLAEGHEVVTRLLELDPKFSVSQFAARSPAVRATEYAHVLRAIGAPE